jgi:hypothetical protein
MFLFPAHLHDAIKIDAWLVLDLLLLKGRDLYSTKNSCMLFWMKSGKNKMLLNDDCVVSVKHREYI